MSLPIIIEGEHRSEPPAGPLQTIAAVLAALAATFTVVAQWKDHPRIATALAFLALAVVIGTFGRHGFGYVRGLTTKRARNKNARAENAELLRLARRLNQFVSNGDPTNIRNIVLGLVSNDQEKGLEICPPNCLWNLVPYFIQDLEVRPPENEKHFLIAVQEFHSLVASYNNNYVLEPFRRMQMKKWPVGTQGGETNPLQKPKLGTWLESLPAHFQGTAERQIEDFRERWVGFLDDS